MSQSSALMPSVVAVLNEREQEQRGQLHAHHLDKGPAELGLRRDVLISHGAAVLAVQCLGADSGVRAAKTVVEVDSPVGGSVRNGNWGSRCAVIVCALSAPISSLVAQQVRDSAGVRIVSYARDGAPKRRWTLESNPSLEIGGNADDGLMAFAGVSGVVRLRTAALRWPT